jgi:peptidoglycan/LPS O-acetylase OafA/YrhL
MRRLKTRRALQICIGAAASTLVAVLLFPTDSHAALIAVLAGIACVSGMAAVVLRFVENPREVVLQRVVHERWLIH